MIVEVTFRLMPSKFQQKISDLAIDESDEYNDLPEGHFQLKTDWSNFKFRSEKKKKKLTSNIVKLNSYFESNPSSDYFNLRPNVTKLQQKAQTGETNQVIYDTTFSIDKNHRRITTGADENQKYAYHLAITGGSYVFGEGLSDEDTLASQIQRATQEFRVFNLGIPGASIVDSIATITLAKNWDDIHPRRGIVLVPIYQFYFSRFLGSTRIVGTWYRNAYLKVDPQTKRYVYGGTVRQDQKLKIFVSTLLSYSRFLDAIEFDWPPLNEDVYEQYAKAIDDFRFYYRQKFGSENQVVAYLPPSSEASRPIVKYLEKNNIPYLDYSSFSSLRVQSDKNLFFEYDGHPTAEYNRIMAELLLKALNDKSNRAKIGIN